MLEYKESAGFILYFCLLPFYLIRLLSRLRPVILFIVFKLQLRKCLQPKVNKHCLALVPGYIISYLSNPAMHIPGDKELLFTQPPLDPPVMMPGNPSV